MALWLTVVKNDLFLLLYSWGLPMGDHETPAEDSWEGYREQPSSNIEIEFDC